MKFLDLLSAAKTVVRENITIYKATKLFGIPHNTPKKFISDNEDLNHPQVLKLKSTTLVETCQKKLLGNGGGIQNLNNALIYAQEFLKISPHTVRQWQTLSLSMTISPSRIWNVDETGLTYVVKPNKVICQVGKKYVCKRSYGERGQIHTLVGCVCADSTFILPMIIFKGLAECCNETFPKGWICTKLFLEWFQFFVISIPDARPVVLLMDSHGAHKRMAVETPNASTHQSLSIRHKTLNLDVLDCRVNIPTRPKVLKKKKARKTYDEGRLLGMWCVCFQFFSMAVSKKTCAKWIQCSFCRAPYHE
ncbi:hypothetical protein PR048_023904 [Dryococelus australis]|uniref:DDE-1 domain-containing protein n=1 Tax=Dryococelus australis TaxID=614101 RepID=A0ABQ9GVE9_9NEOP|nr:hypothetical protein PR048_023904 [Dryococelus australis]